jgi:hypothetical protein
MSEVSGDDDVRPVLGFLYRVLRLEMLQLRRHDRPHHCQQPSKESGGQRSSDRYSGVNRDVIGLASCRESGSDILFLTLSKGSRPHTFAIVRC